jgi:hypothetical protein
MVSSSRELREEEEAAGEFGSPTSVADASSCKRALADGEATAVHIPATDVDGVRWRWPAMASREAVVRGERGGRMARR